LKKILCLTLGFFVAFSACNKKATEDTTKGETTKVNKADFQNREIVKSPPPESLKATDAGDLANLEQARQDQKPYQHGNPAAYGNEKYKLEPIPMAKFDPEFTAKALKINEKYNAQLPEETRMKIKIDGKVYNSTKKFEDIVKYYEKEFDVTVRDLEKDGPMDRETILRGDLRDKRTGLVRSAPMATQVIPLSELGETIDSSKPEYAGNYKEALFRVPGLGTIIVREKYIDPITFEVNNKSLILITKEIKPE
jgi:hypothetical protein